MTEVERQALSRLLGRDSGWIKWARNQKRKELATATCTMSECTWTGNSRSDVEVAMEDMLRHVRASHDSRMRKHERDVERTLRLRKAGKR